MDQLPSGIRHVWPYNFLLREPHFAMQNVEQEWNSFRDSMEKKHAEIDLLLQMYSQRLDTAMGKLGTRQALSAAFSAEVSEIAATMRRIVDEQKALLLLEQEKGTEFEKSISHAGSRFTHRLEHAKRYREN